MIDKVLEASRSTGYPQLEGRACWLMGECLAADAPASAEDYTEAAMCLLESIGAKNDLARAIVLWATLRQRTGDTTTARQSLTRARAIFKELGTRDEFARVDAALAALDRGLPIRLLTGQT